jgi:hypothetical protein
MCPATRRKGGITVDALTGFSVELDAIAERERALRARGSRASSAR